MKLKKIKDIIDDAYNHIGENDNVDVEWFYGEVGKCNRVEIKDISTFGPSCPSPAVKILFNKIKE